MDGFYTQLFAMGITLAPSPPGARFDIYRVLRVYAPWF